MVIGSLRFGYICHKSVSISEVQRFEVTGINYINVTTEIAFDGCVNFTKNLVATEFRHFDQERVNPEGCFVLFGMSHYCKSVGKLCNIAT